MVRSIYKYNYSPTLIALFSRISSTEGGMSASLARVKYTTRCSVFVAVCLSYLHPTPTVAKNVHTAH
jgi:hypothetical protein